MGVTNLGLNMLMDRFLNGGVYLPPTKFSVGRGTTAFNATQTNLVDPVPIVGTETVDSCDVADWTDSADMTTTVNTLTYKQGVGSLNLTKDATGSATATVNKTTTSLDFTSKELTVWFYILDATALAKLNAVDAIVIRYGSDGANYYEFKFQKASLAVGWNLLQNMTSTTGIETGTVVLTACDYSYLAVTSTVAGDTWIDGDVIMDYWQLVSADDLFGNFEIGFPTIDTTNLQITYRASLLSPDAVGYNIAEIGVFSEDTTPAMWSRAVITPFSKSETEELRFIIKDQFSAN